MNDKQVFVFSTIISFQIILVRTGFGTEIKSLPAGIDVSTPSISRLGLGSVDVDSGTMHKMISAHERLLIRDELDKGNVCGAASEFKEFKHGFKDPDDQTLFDDILIAFEAAPADKVMECAADYRALLGMTPQNSGSGFEHVEQVNVLMDRKNYAAAQAHIGKVMTSWPKHKFAPWLLFYDAECYFNLKQYKQAAHAYRVYYETFPDGTMIKQAKEQEIISHNLIKDKSQKP